MPGCSIWISEYWPRKGTTFASNFGKEILRAVFQKRVKTPPMPRSAQASIFLLVQQEVDIVRLIHYFR
jgi:hypothetical protein